MKLIGTTNLGNRLLEATADEFRMLVVLREALKGDTREIYPRDLEQFESDLAPAFDAIRQWVIVKDRINGLRRVTDLLDAEIKTPKAER